jgi:hypothetical protein
MAIAPIPVDQRVIGIDSRRFASIEKSLVELMTNSDDSYNRLENPATELNSPIRIQYERHQNGALLNVTDQAEGMSFEQARAILTYGAAHSPLAKGEGGGRGYFGRGLKQAIYGLGHGWIETLHQGRFSRIELYRAENGGYLYDDGGGDRPATSRDYERLGITDHGTRITIVIENPQVNLSHYQSLVQAVTHNVYLRDVLNRRQVDMISLRDGKEVEISENIRYQEPQSTVLLGPEQVGSFVYEGRDYPFTLTLKRAVDAELTLRGDERTNGLVILSDMAVLDCQLFAYENQVGTEYLFGTVRCPALLEQLGQGLAIISDEREGLNLKEPFVSAFAEAVSALIAPFVIAEQEKLKHLERATTSGRTARMIEHLLVRMNQAAFQDLGLEPEFSEGSSETLSAQEKPAALRFSTPFYYRPPGHSFHVALLLDPAQFSGDERLVFEYHLPDSMQIEPAPTEIAFQDVSENHRFEWRVSGENAGDRGEIRVRAGAFWAWTEVVVAQQASHAHHAHSDSTATHHNKTHKKRSLDHGIDMFVGYEFRNLNNDLERAVYSPTERKILINTGAPTVQLYVDGRGHFRDSARLLLAELFMDVIADELARRTVDKSGHAGDLHAYHCAKQAIIRRYGSDIHLSFVNT